MSTKIPPRTPNGRGWGYAGALLGALVSVAANVAHGYVPPAGAPDGWRPPTGAVIGAVFWPVALLTAIEILARTAWPTGARWVLLRFGGLLPVATVAALVSYGHMSGLLAAYGEPAITAHLGPLAVDGLMVMASSALIATSPTRPATASETPVPDTPEHPSEQPGNRTPRPHTGVPRRPTRKTAPPRRTPEELAALATALNEAALASTGAPVSLRRLRTELRVGRDTALRLRDAATVPHANGTALRDQEVST